MNIYVVFVRIACTKYEKKEKKLTKISLLFLKNKYFPSVFGAQGFSVVVSVFIPKYFRWGLFVLCVFDLLL